LGCVGEGVVAFDGVSVGSQVEDDAVVVVAVDGVVADDAVDAVFGEDDAVFAVVVDDVAFDGEVV
jgi:hypothetical protein